MLFVVPITIQRHMSFNISYSTYKVFVSYCTWYPFYMGFLEYLRWYMYRISSKNSQIWAPCPKIETQNMELVHGARPPTGLFTQSNQGNLVCLCEECTTGRGIIIQDGIEGGHWKLLPQRLYQWPGGIFHLASRKGQRLEVLSGDTGGGGVKTSTDNLLWPAKVPSTGVGFNQPHRHHSWRRITPGGRSAHMIIPPRPLPSRNGNNPRERGSPSPSETCRAGAPG